MRKIHVHLPGLFGPDDSFSALSEAAPAVATRLSEVGRVRRLAHPTSGTFEAAYLGLPPDSVAMAQGPLTVAALGFDPPTESTHFHLSLASLSGGQVQAAPALGAQESRELWLALPRLNTRRLTLLEGGDHDHGLVWEARGDLLTVPFAEARGKPIGSVLPQGDAERELRRLLDDSVNLLGELEMNRQREEEGLSVVNLVWPWGEGVRQAIPNLAWRYGFPVSVESASIRLQGLSRLARLRHSSRSSIGPLLRADWRALARRLLSAPAAIVVIDLVPHQSEDQLDELIFITKELASGLLTPLLDSVSDSGSRLLVSAPAKQMGLVVEVASELLPERLLPFGTRVLEDPTISAVDLHEAVASSFAQP